jgi:chemotaxis regulatin CheY-phosphate phosphatase CheZ
VAYITNNRIMHFIKSLIYYLSEEVIEMNWIKLTRDLSKVNNFEDIIASH